MKRTPALSKYLPPVLANIENKRPPLKVPFKYEHVPRFRHKADSRTRIINNMLPDEFKLSSKMLFYSIYFDDDIHLFFKGPNPISVEQTRILDLGSNLLMLRLYNILLTNRPETNPIELIDSINPMEINTLKIRHDFINQFNQILDSKNLLSKIAINSSILKTIKIERSTRHKVLPMLIGLVHCQYGYSKSKKFIDEWVIRGKWSTEERYNHKGLLEIYTDKKMDVF